MSTKTPNYNLVKPEAQDFIDISVLNGNMDIIDAILKTKYGAENKPTATDIGAVAWSNNPIEETDIKTWAEKQTNPTTVAVSPTVKGMPFDGSYWLVSLMISALGAWKTLVATRIGSDVPTGQKYENALVNGVWGGWTQLATVDYVDALTPADIGAAPAFTYGTDEIEAGSPSTEPEGSLHFIIE